jgi:hypothetical protein
VNLWIDAICINQKDVEERNLQVFRMKSIFRQADEVVAWLGVEPLKAPNVFDSIQIPSAIHSPFDKTAIFGPIFAFQYWRRVWVRLTVLWQTPTPSEISGSRIDYYKELFENQQGTHT